MSYFSGAILDVSGSMQTASHDSDMENSKWVRALFDVIDDLIVHDVTSRSKVLVIGAGANRMPGNAFDVIKAIKITQDDQLSDSSSTKATDETIDDIFRTLEKSGAKHIRKWAETDTVSRQVKEGEAKLVLKELRDNKAFRNKFVNVYLPASCRDWVEKEDNSFLGGFFYQVQRVYSSVVSSRVQATDSDICRVIEQAIHHLLRVDSDSVYTADVAAEIVRRGDGVHKKLSPERSEEIHQKIKPYIYGATPLYSALKDAAQYFPGFKEDGKYLFVFSDGEPSDYGNVDTIKASLENKDVKVIGCYIYSTPWSTVKPQQLYSIANYTWEDGARFLFDISSEIPSDIVPRAILSHTGWEFDIANDETKLFLHVNSPENMKSAVKAVRKALSSQDCLIDLLARVSLDVYIRNRYDEFQVPEQIGKTCYANAAATVMHLAMLSIHGRDGGYPEFETLRKEIIDKFGKEGADTLYVLNKVCPRYRLQCKVVDNDGAMKAVSKKRPLIARFELCETGWKKFNTFFDDTPTDTLSKQDMDIARYTFSPNKIGHAVVLTGYNSTGLHLMNFKGENWGNKGFFRIENAEVLKLDFINIFWTKEGLSEREREHYSLYGPSIAKQMVRNLRGIKDGTYTCPKCKEESMIKEFHGTLIEAVCPRCTKAFKSNDGDGNIIALNIYLTSLNN